MEMHLWKKSFVEEKLNKLRKNWDDRKTERAKQNWWGWGQTELSPQICQKKIQGRNDIIEKKKDD